VHVVCEAAFDGADELMHARERLDVEQLAHAYGARHANLPEIVAQKIDDHDVLGAVLRARAQLLCERAVARRIGRARPRALDRLGLDAPALHAQEALRRRAHDLAVGPLEIRRERRRVDVAQAKIGVPCVAFRFGLEPLREVHLITIAAADVLLHGAKRARVCVAAQIRPRRTEHAKRRRLRRRLGREARHERVPNCERAAVAPVAR
jgi:hypothetical protein